MKKKTKTILSLLLIAALLGFNFAIIAKADVIPSGDSTPGAAAGTATGATAFNPKRIGYRIAYVDQDGNKIGHAYDLILDPGWTSGTTRGGNTIYTLNGTVDKKIRQEYLGGGGGTFSPNVAGIIGQNATQLVAYGGQGATSLPGELGQLVNSALTAMSFKNGAERVFKGAYEYLKKYSANAADFETAINQVLRLFGTSETYATLTQPSTKNPGQTVASERFIQFEPLFFTNEAKCNGNFINNGKNCSGSWVYIRGVYGTAIEIANAELAYQALSTAGVVYPEIGKRAPKPWCVGEGVNCVVQNNRTTYDVNSIKNASVATEVEFIYMGDIISQPTYDCTAIVDALKNQVKGSNPYLYKTLVERLRTASETSPFEAWLDMDGDGTTEKITVNTPQDFELMVESNYMDNQKNPYHDQSAHCAPATPVPDICSGNYPGTADLDDCVTGKTFYSDYPSEDAWLVCEIAFSDKGKHTSDNTNHITTQANTEDNKTMASGTVVYGNTVGNDPYCKLFCMETFETSFPTSVYGVKAGQVFAWGSDSGTFGSVHIEKICKNKELNESRGEGYLYKKWKSDYVSNERELVTDYLTYAANKKYLEKIGYNHKNITNVSCQNEYTSGPHPVYIRTVCVATGENVTKNYVDSSISNDHQRGPYIGNQSGSSGVKDGKGIDYNKNTANATDLAQRNAYAKYEKDMNDFYKLWKDREQDEDAYQLYIKQCTKNLKYVYETVINLVFDEPVNNAYGPNTRNFSSRDELDMDPPKDPLHETGYNTNNVDVSKCKDRNSYTYKCQYDRGCKPIKLQVKDCEQVTWKIEGDWTYSFPAGIFEWYSYKVDGTVINETGQGINIPGKNQLSMADAYFYYIGYTLPTALSLTDGQYEMSVAVTNLGDNGTSNQGYNIPNGHFADLTGTNALGKSGFDYTCIYEVENEMFGYDCRYDASTLQGISPEFCDPSDDGDSEGYLNGVDVAYRVIQLLEDTDSINKSFPGLDGQGRTIGKNWQLSEEELHRILDARAIQSDQAMYEIMLDINAIQFIRRDNARYFNGASGANPYTSYVDYNGQQKIICVGDSSSRKYCASTFLDTLQNLNGGALTDDYILRGTCLPQGLTAEARANEILANGCGNSYTYPTINWAR